MRIQDSLIPMLMGKICSFAASPGAEACHHRIVRFMFLNSLSELSIEI